MVRSLYAGISGLKNHQVAMDVIGANIANVNTVGFKASRVTFEESMAQLIQGATRPDGNAGGTNPIQVGLGMAVGSTDAILTQGNLQTTGQITDLALEGNAYFAYSNGTGNFYSRNGALQFDALGRLVLPTNGFRLQGMMSDYDGTYPAGTRIGDIKIPFGEKSPAQETTEVKYACNLDSDSEGLGSITHTNRFLAQARTGDTLTSLFDSNGNDLGIQVGDNIIVSMSGQEETLFRVEEGMDVSDLAGMIQTYLQDKTSDVNIQVTPVGDGLQVDLGLADPTSIINGLQVRSSRPGSNSYVATALAFPSSIPANGSATITGLRVPATEDDLISDIYDANGQALGLERDDVIKINGAIGGGNITPVEVVYNSTDPTDTTTVLTLGDLMNRIQDAFKFPETDGTIYDNPSVSMDGSDTDDDGLPDGSIVIRGQPEQAFAITALTVQATNSNNLAPAPVRFNANMGFTEVQAARDTLSHSTSIVVYDESGDAHTMTTTFTRTARPAEWLWQVNMEDGEQILGGNRGTITFGQDGSPSSFTFDDQSTYFRFDPMNGSNIVQINMNVGSPGSFQGITQFRSPTTTAAREQDGYTMGKLQEISIDETGEISGIYTNGISKSLARIYVAEFNNPAGLLKMGDSVYAVSNNSGEGVMLRPGCGFYHKD